MRRLVLSALCVLSLTACGSRADFTTLVGTSPDGQPLTGVPNGSTGDATTGGLPGSTGTTGGSATATGGALGTTTGTSGATSGAIGGSATGFTGPVNKTPIRLAYIIQGSAGVSALTGSNVGSSDSNVAVRTMNALVAYANSHGGVGGRKISAQGFKSEATSQEAERLALCKQITEDYKAQVLIDQNQYLSEDGWSCFAQHHVNYFGNTTGTDRVFLSKNAPYLSTTWLAEDRSIKAMVDGGEAAGFYKGGKVGVLMMDNPTQHRLYDTKVKPALAAIGVTNPTVRFVSEDTSTVATQTNAAELAFASSQVNRVVFLAHIIVYLGFTNQAQSQGYHPRYIFSDYQGMTGVAAFYGTAAQNANAVGVSSTLSGVLDDASHSSTDTTSPYDRKKMSPGQTRCLDLLTKQTGKNYYDPQASGDTLATWSWFCDEFFAWWDGAKAVGASWTPAKLGAGLATVRTYQSTVQHTVSFAGGVHDGATTYRVGLYNASCKCFVKTTRWLPI